MLAFPYKRSRAILSGRAGPGDRGPASAGSLAGEPLASLRARAEIPVGRTPAGPVHPVPWNNDGIASMDHVIPGHYRICRPWRLAGPGASVYIALTGGNVLAHRRETLVKEFEVRPDPDDPRLSVSVPGIDHEGKPVETAVVAERPLTLFLNAREIVTMMTIGDRPDLLAVGYLLNQNMLKADDDITAVDYDEDIAAVVVRTRRQTDFEDKLKKKIQTSGCAQGTVFGDLMEEFDQVKLNPVARVKTSWLYQLTRKINTSPSLYLKAGAIHGCVLAHEDKPLIYMEDVGRHNAVDKIAGYMFLNHIAPEDKIFYTTGRLTSEMVIKTVKMRIPVLVSRSGFTAWGVELAQKANLTLIGRARGKRFVALAGLDRLVFDADPKGADDEDRRHARKGSLADAGD
jgi:FdhD protein